MAMGRGGPKHGGGSNSDDDDGASPDEHDFLADIGANLSVVRSSLTGAIISLEDLGENDKGLSVKLARVGDILRNTREVLAALEQRIEQERSESADYWVVKGRPQQ